MLYLEGAHFAFDKADLTEFARDTLGKVAKSLIANPDVKIEVAGHTDWVGTNAYNQKLSRARAMAVRDYLVANGVAADRITSVWFGEEKPVADNTTKTGRAKNRRTEVKRIN